MSLLEYIHINADSIIMSSLELHGRIIIFKVQNKLIRIVGIYKIWIIWTIKLSEFEWKRLKYRQRWECFRVPQCRLWRIWIRCCRRWWLQTVDSSDGQKPEGCWEGWPRAKEGLLVEPRPWRQPSPEHQLGVVPWEEARTTPQAEALHLQEPSAAFHEVEELYILYRWMKNDNSIKSTNPIFTSGFSLVYIIILSEDIGSNKVVVLEWTKVMHITWTSTWSWCPLQGRDGKSQWRGLWCPSFLHTSYPRWPLQPPESRTSAWIPSLERVLWRSCQPAQPSSPVETISNIHLCHFIGIHFNSICLSIVISMNVTHKCPFMPDRFLVRL